MPTEPITRSALGLDLSARFYHTETVSASPAAGSITTIATLTIPANIAAVSGVYLLGWAAFTAGTNGISALLGIRQTNTTGSVVGAGNAATVVAANLYEQNVQGFDASPTLPGQVYVLTLTIGSGSASSIVSACSLIAVVV